MASKIQVVNHLSIQTSPTPQPTGRGRAWSAMTSSLLLHLGLVAASISVPFERAELASVRSGKAAIELQGAQASPSTPASLSIRPDDAAEEVDAPDEVREAAPPARQLSSPSTGPRMVAQPSPVPPPTSPPPPASEPSFEPLEWQRVSAQVRLPEVLDLPSDSTVIRRTRVSSTVPPPLASSAVVPSAVDAGADRETPRPLPSNLPPRYPAEAIAARVEGTTTLRAIVSDEGNVTRIEVQESSGSTALDRAATSAVSNWRFEPQTSKIRGGSQSVLVPIQFQLNR